jgi:hypothetical protein
MFPQGPFQGSVNIAVKGEHVHTAQEAKELIDACEQEYANKQGTIKPSANSHLKEIESKVVDVPADNADGGTVLQ